MKTKLFTLFLLLSLCSIDCSFGQEKVPSYYWDLEDIRGRSVTEIIKTTTDTVEGNYKIVKGVSGNAIRLDGYTTVICNKGKKDGISSGSLSTEAWIALGAYPWNWCPVVAQSKNEVGGKENSGGFSMEIGPRGELGLKIFIEGNEILCVSEKFAIPLFEWTYIAAIYTEGSGIKIFINGNLTGSYDIMGKANYSNTNGIRIGMNNSAVNPSNLIGQAGYKPFWFSIDGIIDEVKIYNSVLTEEYFKDVFKRLKPKSRPDKIQRKP